MGQVNLNGFYRDGLFRREVEIVSTGSTAPFVITQEQSGSIFSFGVVSTIGVELPRISSNWLGLTYEILFSTAATEGDYTVGCVADTSGVIHLALTSAGVGTPSTITPNTTDSPHGIRVTAISSVVWMGEPLFSNQYTTVAKAAAAGGWTTA